MYAFQEVKENYTPELQRWYDVFHKADRIKRLAWDIANFDYREDIRSKMDRRVDFAWSKVKEVEPFPTFINGELTDKAAYYLNGIKILKLTKQI